MGYVPSGFEIGGWIASILFFIQLFVALFFAVIESETGVKVTLISIPVTMILVPVFFHLLGKKYE